MTRLKRISFYEVWMPLKSDFRTSFGTTKLRPAIIVRVEDDSGLEGWGEIVAGEGPWYSYETVWTAWHIALDFLVKMIPGDGDPAKFVENAERVRGHNMAKAGIECNCGRINNDNTIPAAPIGIRPVSMKWRDARPARIDPNIMPMPAPAIAPCT